MGCLHKIKSLGGLLSLFKVQVDFCVVTKVHGVFFLALKKKFSHALFQTLVHLHTLRLSRLISLPSEGKMQKVKKYIWRVIHVAYLKQTNEQKLNEDYGDTVPSKLHNIGVQGAGDPSSNRTLKKLHRLKSVELDEGLSFLLLFVIWMQFFLKVNFTLMFLSEQKQRLISINEGNINTSCY